MKTGEVVDTIKIKEEIQNIRNTIIISEKKLHALYDYLYAFEEKIIDKEELEIDLWFDKIRQTTISKNV